MCVGCRSCTVACQAVRGLVAEATPLVINISEEINKEGELKLRFAAEACRHCADAPCVETCPVDAICFEDDGKVVINEEDCIYCGDCVEECPYKVMFLDHERETAVKCNLCSARVEKNLKPACVAACPGKAIYAGQLEDIEGAIDERRKAFRKKHEQ